LEVGTKKHYYIGKFHSTTNNSVAVTHTIKIEFWRGKNKELNTESFTLRIFLGTTTGGRRFSSAAFIHSS
jgi:hypothetical protein